jgi:L-lactate permease
MSETLQLPAAEDKEQKKPSFNQEAKLAALSDLCFVLLPFIVIVIVLVFSGRIRELLYIPEWSIATPVVVGQIITRIVAASVNRSVVKEGIVFLLCAVIVFLLVPSLIVLGFVLEVPKVTTAMAVTQIALFLAGVGFSFIMNSLLFDVEHNSNPKTIKK